MKLKEIPSKIKQYLSDDDIFILGVMAGALFLWVCLQYAVIQYPPINRTVAIFCLAPADAGMYIAFTQFVYSLRGRRAFYDYLKEVKPTLACLYIAALYAIIIWGLIGAAILILL